MNSPPTRPGLIRRLAAIFYDSLLLFAILYIATLPLLMLTHGRAIEPGNLYFLPYLLLVSFVFLGWFWTHGGQTLGMRAWRMRVQQPGGGNITWSQALLRFAAAILSWAAGGLGFLWILVDRDRMAWHDRLSRTEVILLEKK